MYTHWTPEDLRTEDPRSTALKEGTEDAATATVRGHLGDDCWDVLAALGLAVTA